MRTYRELFSVGEFRVLFGTQCLVVASVSIGSLALGTITYAATASPVLTALAMFGGPLVQLIGSQFLAVGQLLGPLSADGSAAAARAMSIMSAASIIVTVALTPGLRRSSEERQLSA